MLTSLSSLPSVETTATRNRVSFEDSLDSSRETENLAEQ